MTLELFRDGARVVVGHSLQFRACGAIQDGLIHAVRSAYGLDDDDDVPYVVEADGTAVRMTYDATDDSCLVMVAHGAFGTAYVGSLIAEGMGGLFRTR